MIGFYASHDVPIRKFKISYPGGKVAFPKFRKFRQADGSVIFKFAEGVPFYKGCNFEWISVVGFEANVSPIFEPQTKAEKKLLQIDKYQFRLLQFKKEVG